MLITHPLGIAILRALEFSTEDGDASARAFWIAIAAGVYICGCKVEND